LNNIFGCVEAYNDLNDVGYCTKCIDGYELDENNNCYNIEP
jgi:hypothetical protein